MLQPLIANLLSSNKSTEIYLEQIWDAIKNTVPGNPSKPDEYQTNDYGTLYRNTISQKIVDKFGAVRKRKNDGTVLIFDEQKIKQLEICKDIAPQIKSALEKDQCNRT